MSRTATLIIAALMVASFALPAQAWILVNGGGNNGVSLQGCGTSGARLLAIELPTESE